MSDVRIGIIGLGVMGTNYARVAGHVRGGTLVATVDLDIVRARVAAMRTGATATTSLDEALDQIDLAVVAVPTAAHAAVVGACIDAGAHILVEKPIAGSVGDAQLLVKAAADAGVILAVGHVERFNAAAAELPRLLERPLHISATRLSPYSTRNADGVIHDLMIHDLDVVLTLAGPDANVVATSGIARRTRGAGTDLAIATVRFDTGLTASFETSRIAQQKIRSVEVTQADSVVVADLVRQHITIHRMSHHEYLADDGVRLRQSSVVEVPSLEHSGEPLLRQLQDVVDAVTTGRSPTVTGEDGVRALALADRIAADVISD